MLTLYLVCLILGGALVALSVFGVGEIDTDVDVDVLDGVAGEGLSAAAQFLSLRSIVFFAAFFGLTGLVLTVFGVGSLLTPIAAGITGVTAAAVVARLMQYFAAEESGVAEARDLAGTMAEVLVEIGDGSAGKIAVRDGERTRQLVARVHEQAATRRFRVGDEVVVVELERGVAHVAGKAFLA